ncbi:hypothetical protein [Pseudomonas sp. 25571]|uniref:hypothetical protein n=1 Tax=Pseudomonas sp. 25571 TaxID=2967216 RepID=UPI0023646D8A|nr:hypothetical protein [Pseudomonas sp. 25571]MDD2063693.1 hypothetical protein [Pseudomonas sp. 25571]
MPEAQPVAPLTIIAIFAGIIEASALATLPFLNESSQSLYTWFLVGFPFFLTALFFLTLNFNYKSFYNPVSSKTTSDSPTATVTEVPEPITVIFSGPDAQPMLEQQVRLALAQSPEPAHRWRFCNLEKNQCARLSVCTLEQDAANLRG